MKNMRGGRGSKKKSKEKGSPGKSPKKRTAGRGRPKKSPTKKKAVNPINLD